MYTPGFAAPEMYRRDGTLGPWTDIYAIGACIYACMQGYPPNDAPQRLEKDRLSLSLSRLRNVYSDNLLEVTEWCMRAHAALGIVEIDRQALLAHQIVDTADVVEDAILGGPHDLEMEFAVLLGEAFAGGNALFGRFQDLAQAFEILLGGARAG